LNYPFLLKFSSVNNLSDARYAAGAWADFLGLNFNPQNEKYIEPAKAKEILSWINGPLICGEFTNQPLEWIQDFIQAMDLKVIQIPSTYPNHAIFNKEGMKYILEVEDCSYDANFKFADVFLTSDLDVYKELKSKTDKPVLFELSDLKINANEFDGIALIGQEEPQPGMRNHGEWTDFLEKWEED
jgi:phosphoribosylanthranilate isomerase